MNYEQIIRETEELTRRMELKWDIVSGLLIAMMATLIILMIKVIMDDRKARKAQETFGGHEYKPTVTENVQIVNGTEFHRMGVPGKEFWK